MDEQIEGQKEKKTAPVCFNFLSHVKSKVDAADQRLKIFLQHLNGKKQLRFDLKALQSTCFHHSGYWPLPNGLSALCDVTGGCCHLYVSLRWHFPEKVHRKTAGRQQTSALQNSKKIVVALEQLRNGLLQRTRTRTRTRVGRPGQGPSGPAALHKSQGGKTRTRAVCCNHSQPCVCAGVCQEKLGGGCGRGHRRYGIRITELIRIKSVI